MKILAITGSNGEPMTTPSIWFENLLLKEKYVCDVAKKESLLNSLLVIFRFVIYIKMRFVRFISLQEIIDITINLILNYIASLNITKNQFKKLYPLLHHRLVFLLKENF